MLQLNRKPDLKAPRKTYLHCPVCTVVRNHRQPIRRSSKWLHSLWQGHRKGRYCETNWANRSAIATPIHSAVRIQKVDKMN